MTISEKDETPLILAEIPGGSELLAWFGREPNFGDAEVLSLCLDRGVPSRLRVAVDKLVRGKDEGDYSFETIIVTFTLHDMIGVSLEGFGGQNVIGGLTIRRASESPVHKSLVGIGLSRPDHILELEPCAGAFGRIWASVASISIETATPPA